MSPPSEENAFYLATPLEDGTPAFSELAAQAGVADKGSALGAAWGDLDADGWLDLVVANRAGQPSRVFRNLGTDSQTEPPVRVLLRGSVSNPDGLGTRVGLEACGQRQERVRSPGASVLSSGEETIHFGVGTCSETVELEVRWPSGIVDRLAIEPGREPGQILAVVEGEG